MCPKVCLNFAFQYQPNQSQPPHKRRKYHGTSGERRHRGEGAVYARPHTPALFGLSTSKLENQFASVGPNRRLPKGCPATASTPGRDRVQPGRRSEDRTTGQRSVSRLSHQRTSFSDRCTGALASSPQTLLRLGDRSTTRFPATPVYPVDSRSEEHASNATINRELACLKRMYRLAYQASPPRVPSVPHFPHLRENNVRQGFVTPEQYANLVAHCKDHWLRAMLETAHDYGWRVSELLNLRVGRVDLVARTIRLDPGTTKNLEGRSHDRI